MIVFILCYFLILIKFNFLFNLIKLFLMQFYLTKIIVLLYFIELYSILLNVAFSDWLF